MLKEFIMKIIEPSYEIIDPKPIFILSYFLNSLNSL
jgi:hypothetical protein